MQHKVCIVSQSEFERSKNSPRPGIEPGPPGWKPGILTPRPSGTYSMLPSYCWYSNCLDDQIRIFGKSIWYRLRKVILLECSIYFADIYLQWWDSGKIIFDKLLKIKQFHRCPDIKNKIQFLFHVRPGLHGPSSSVRSPVKTHHGPWSESVPSAPVEVRVGLDFRLVLTKSSR